jgi:hypothetical protein
MRVIQLEVKFKWKECSEASIDPIIFAKLRNLAAKILRIIYLSRLQADYGDYQRLIYAGRLFKRNSLDSLCFFFEYDKSLIALIMQNYAELKTILNERLTSLVANELHFYVDLLIADLVEIISIGEGECLE